MKVVMLGLVGLFLGAIAGGGPSAGTGSTPSPSTSRYSEVGSSSSISTSRHSSR